MNFGMLMSSSILPSFLFVSQIDCIDDQAKTADGCWQQVQNVINSCWEADPEKRPMFFELAESISKLLQDQMKQLPAPRDVGLLVQSVMNQQRGPPPPDPPGQPSRAQPPGQPAQTPFETVLSLQ